MSVGVSDGIAGKDHLPHAHLAILVDTLISPIRRAGLSGSRLRAVGVYKEMSALLKDSPTAVPRSLPG